MWQYNGIQIYVTGLDETESQIIARLQPLSSTTVLQVFGDEAPVYKVDFLVVGNTNRDSLKALVNDGTAYTLSGFYFSKNLYLSKISFRRSKYIYQTIDTNQGCDVPVYEASMELME